MFNNKTCVRDAHTAGRRNTITVRSDYRAETFANQNTQYIVVTRYGCVQFAQEFTIHRTSIEGNSYNKGGFLRDRSDKDTMGNVLRIISQQYFYSFNKYKKIYICIYINTYRCLIIKKRTPDDNKYVLYYFVYTTRAEQCGKFKIGCMIQLCAVL